RARVLVAEDHSVNQQVTLKLLERLGCSALIATTGRAAVAACAAGGFDLVLMDCQMPEMDGYEATQRIRASEQGARVPIVALTASGLAAERERGLAAGMDDYLTKPVNPSALEAILRKWVDRGTAPAAPPTAAGAALDDGILAELRAFTSAAFLHETIDLFFASAKKGLAALKDAHARGDMRLLERTAHSLRGSCAIIGARRMMQLAAGIEDQARAGRSEGLADLLVTLEAEHGAIRTALDRERQNLPGGPTEAPEGARARS